MCLINHFINDLCKAKCVEICFISVTICLAIILRCSNLSAPCSSCETICVKILYSIRVKNQKTMCAINLNTLRMSLYINIYTIISLYEIFVSIKICKTGCTNVNTTYMLLSTKCTLSIVHIKQCVSKYIYIKWYNMKTMCAKLNTTCFSLWINIHSIKSLCKPKCVKLLRFYE